MLDLQDIQIMLSERVGEWTELWKQEGRQEGEAAVLLRLMEQKYGSDATQAWRQKVAQAESEALLSWVDRILTARTIDEIFR